MDNSLQQSCSCLAAQQLEVVKGNLVQLRHQSLHLVHFSFTNKNSDKTLLMRKPGTSLSFRVYWTVGMRQNSTEPLKLVPWHKVNHVNEAIWVH